MSTFAEVEERGHAEDVLHLRDKVLFLEAEHVHRHFAGVEVDAEGLGCLDEFLERRHIVLAHQIAEYLRTSAEEVEAARGSDLQSAHHEAEEFGEPITARERAALLLLDGVETPEGEEDVHLIAYCCRART